MLLTDVREHEYVHVQSLLGLGAGDRDLNTIEKIVMTAFISAGLGAWTSFSLDAHPMKGSKCWKCPASMSFCIVWSGLPWCRATRSATDMCMSRETVENARAP